MQTAMETRLVRMDFLPFTCNSFDASPYEKGLVHRLWPCGFALNLDHVSIYCLGF